MAWTGRALRMMAEVRGDVSEVVQVVGEEVRRLRRARRALEQAVARRDREIAQAEHRLEAATGGLGLRRWELARRRRRVHTAADAVAAARAARALSAVRSALEELARARAVEDVAVQSATAELGERAGDVLGYGSIGVRLSGMDVAELGRLARRS